MNRKGCMATFLIFIALGTCVWIWTRSTVIFPSRNPILFRNLACIGVLAITVVTLFMLASRKRRDGRAAHWVSSNVKIFLALLVVFAAVGSIAWIWNDYRMLFLGHTAEQWRDISTWAIVVFALVALFRLVIHKSSAPRNFRSDHEPRKPDPEPEPKPDGPDEQPKS